MDPQLAGWLIALMTFIGAAILGIAIFYGTSIRKRLTLRQRREQREAIREAYDKPDG